MAVYDDEKHKSENALADDEQRKLDNLEANYDQEASAANIAEEDQKNARAQEVLNKQRLSAEGRDPGTQKTVDSPEEIEKQEQAGGTGARDMGKHNQGGPEEGGGMFNFRQEKGGKGKGKGLKATLKNMSSKKKLALIAGGGGGGMLAIVIILILLMLSSLKVVNVAEHIFVYQFSRVARESLTTDTEILGEKLAVETEPPGKLQQLKDKYGGMKDKQLEKLNKFRPKKLINDLHANGEIDIQYGKAVKKGGKKFPERLKVGEKVYDTHTRTYSKLDKITHPAQYLKDLTNDTKSEFKAYGELGKALGDRGTSAVVRGLAMKAWRKITKEPAYGFTQEEIDKSRNKSKARLRLEEWARDTKLATWYGETREKATGIKNDKIKKAKEKAAKIRDKCVHSNKCLGKIIDKVDNGGAMIREKFGESLSKSLSDRILGKAVKGANIVYAIALPLCIIYDASAVHSGPTIDKNSHEQMHTFNHIEGAADQQKNGNTHGDISGELIGALADRLGPNITKSVPESRALGGTGDTSHLPSAQASAGGSYETNIIDVVFPHWAAGFVKKSIDGICKVATNLWVGVGVGVVSAAAQIIAAIVTGGGSEAAIKSGEEGVKVAVHVVIKQEIKKIAKQMLSRKELAKLAGLTAGTVGAGIIAHMIVKKTLGIRNDGLASGKDYIDQADSGGNLTAQWIDRYQNYGAPLTTQQTKAIHKQDVSFTRFLNQQQSPYQRYFAIQNPRSLANHMLFAGMAHFHTSTLRSLFSNASQLFNPAFAFAGFGGLIHPGLAHAASDADNTNYGNVQWGWTVKQEDAFENNPTYSMLKNQKILDESGQEDKIASHFKDCYDTNVTMGDLLSKGKIRRKKNGNVIPNKGLCSPNALSMHNCKFKGKKGKCDLVFRWRVAQRYNKALAQLNGKNTYHSPTGGGSADRGATGSPPAGPGIQAAKKYHWGKPAWSKEFNGSKLASDWAVYNSPGNGGHGLRRPSQIKVGKGVMSITGDKNGKSGGMALTDHAAKYGRWEIRFRAKQTGSGGHPYHPIFALIPKGPYHCGATDIDYPEYNLGDTGYLFIHNLPSFQDMATFKPDNNWHTFALEIAPDHLTAFIDGKPIATDNNASHIPKDLKLLNFQLDQYWDGGFNPAIEQADWVRYYPLNTGKQVKNGPPVSIGGYNGAC
jgi:hypothetical protein